jgi:hypothetical protein
MKATTTITAIIMSLGLLGGCGNDTTELQNQIDELTAELEQYRAAEELVNKNLALMRKADESMNARDWDGFKEVHAHDVWVTSPDAPKPQEGMEEHLTVVKAFTDAFPDHEIQLPYLATFGSGEWLAAVHRNGGTFSEPWVMPDGSVIPPTGKSYEMIMVTIGKGDGETLSEERIIYDMYSMARQIGLAPE